MKTKRLVIAYDITDDRRRTEIFHLLKDYSHHIQESVSEANLSPKPEVTLQHRLH